MDTESDYSISLRTLQIFCIIIIVVTLVVNNQIRSFLALIPAKKGEDLRGKRRLAVIASGILVFLAMAACGSLGYTVFLNNYPSIVALIIILLIGLVFGVGQVIKLHFIDSASVKTYEWLDRSEKSNKENSPQ